MTKEEKQIELIKYCKLNLATLDYYIEYEVLNIKTDDYDSKKHYLELKKVVEINFQKGRLTILKQWFRDLTEMQIETKDFKFSAYLKEKTNYDIDIFKSFYDRIDKIIVKGKITTDNQFYDVKNVLNDVSDENKYKENLEYLENELENMSNILKESLL